MSSYEILGIPVANPVLVGSGLLTDQERNIRRLLDEGAGGVVTKTIHPDSPSNPREGVYRIATGMLNNTTYSKRPVNDWLDIIRRFADESLPIIASVHAESPRELAALSVDVLRAGSPALELGISCLNEDHGAPDDPALVFEYTRQVRAAVGAGAPIAVKLAAGDSLSAHVAAALEGGADAITLSDTLPAAALTSDGELAFGGIYGYSGPGIKPLVLAAISRLRNNGADYPIMGVGGIRSGVDVRDYLAVGATVTQIYSCLHNDMYATLRRILRETEAQFERTEAAG